MMVNAYYRKLMIQDLMNRYPYSKEWFESLTDKQLEAMWHKPGKTKNQKEPIAMARQSVRKIIDGVRYVLTECHGWEIEID